MIQFVTMYLNQYGYFVLFFALMLELIAIPIPVEFLLSYAGFLVYQGHLNWLMAILMAALGSSAGVSISYWIGYKLGNPFFEKHGSRIFLGPERIEKTRVWFNKHGNKMLIVAYFIPGVRHITGYFSGITRVTFRVYAIFAYVGAFLWTSTFISLGRVLGTQWNHFHSQIKRYLVIIGIALVILLVVLYLFRKYKTVLKEYIVLQTKRALLFFRTRRRTVVFLLSMAFIALLLVMGMAQIIEGILNNEFNVFNETITFLVPKLFDQKWTGVMQFFLLFGSHSAIAALIIATAGWIWWKGKDKGLEGIFLLFTIAFGQVYEEGLQIFFHHLSLSNTAFALLLDALQNVRTFLVAVVFGYFVYMILRHNTTIWIHTFTISITLSLFVCIGISYIFFHMEEPIDIVTGYILGFVWLNVSILLLEIFRIVRNLESLDTLNGYKK